MADAALLLNVISGHDRMDSTSAPQPVPDYLAQVDRPISGLRIEADKAGRERLIRSDIGRA